MNSVFCGNRYEVEFIPIKTENGTRTHISKEEFCNSPEGSELLKEFRQPLDGKSTKLDVIANFLTIRHARTDSGVAMNRAETRNDQDCENLEYSAIYYRKTEVFLGMA